MGQGIDLLGLVTRLVPERPPPPVDVARLHRVLIIKLSSIGDVVHALPVASALKRRHSSVRITWAVEAWTAPLVRHHPAIDRVIVFPTMTKWPAEPTQWLATFRQAARELRTEPYDVALDLQGLARSACLSALSRAPLRVARQGQREGAHLVSFGVRLPPKPAHAVHEYLQLARFLDADAEPVEFGLAVRPEAAVAVAERLARRGVSEDRPLIVINPTSAHRWKEWPAVRWAAVADALGDAGTVLFVGAREQQTRHAAVLALMRHRPIDFTGHTSLEELVALLQRATLHLAHDNGSVHIAAALGTPVVALYGPTRPWRLAPFDQAARVVHHSDLCGRSCPAYCLYGRRCLTATTVEEVIDKARLVLAGNEASPQAAS